MSALTGLGADFSTRTGPDTAAIRLQGYTMPDIRLIALDLDATLLNTDKQLTPGNQAALERAAAMGVEIVPATGRFFSGMPEEIKSLPFLHYAITVNGAQVCDVRRDCAVCKAEMPLDLALEIMTFLDGFPLIYDCYQDNWGWMSRKLWEIAGEFAPNEHYRILLHDFRKPVPELKAFLRERGRDVQKISLYVKDKTFHRELYNELTRRFPEALVTSSIWNNIELNSRDGNKGGAVLKLAETLGLQPSQTMAFGDGLNDLSMIEKAGIGVAMGNSEPEVLAAADWVAPDCDHDGVAAGIERFCFGTGKEENI